MKRDYRLGLEKAARQMILVRRVDTLVRLILRTIMRNVRVKHAGVFLYDKEQASYIIRVSKGMRGAKIPAGFTKIGSQNPIIRYFTDPRCGDPDCEFLITDRLDSAVKKSRRSDPALVSFLEELREEIGLYKAKVFVPGFFRKNLIGILFLGEKENRTAFTPEELGFLSVLASDVVMSLQNAWLFEDINQQLSINKKLLLSTVTALATAIEAKDKYTMGHTERVMNYSLEIARNMPEIPVAGRDAFEENLRISALLHDIGKIGVPEEVLNKKSALNDEEFKYIRQHPVLGEEILNPIQEFKEIVLGVKYHHERYDGRGYPYRLAGEDIPLAAAIISVADAFDAMTSDRAYRKALSFEEAVREIEVNSGKQFNPLAVKAFLRAFPEKNVFEHGIPAVLSEKPSHRV